MTFRRDPRRPRDFATPPDQWPHGPVIEGAPRYVTETAKIARSVVAALETRTMTDLAATADLAHSTLSKLVRGETWPDIQTITKIEDAIGDEVR